VPLGDEVELAVSFGCFDGAASSPCVACVFPYLFNNAKSSFVTHFPNVHVSFVCVNLSLLMFFIFLCAFVHLSIKLSLCVENRTHSQATRPPTIHNPLPTNEHSSPHVLSALGYCLTALSLRAGTQLNPSFACMCVCVCACDGSGGRERRCIVTRALPSFSS